VSDMVVHLHNDHVRYAVFFAPLSAQLGFLVVWCGNLVSLGVPVDCRRLLSIELDPRESISGAMASETLALCGTITTCKCCRGRRECIPFVDGSQSPPSLVWTDRST
jgi:hypothetical protein